MKQIEQLRERLNALVVKSDVLHRGEVLRLSQELDELIYIQYNKSIKENSGNFPYGM